MTDRALPVTKFDCKFPSALVLFRNGIGGALLGVRQLEVKAPLYFAVEILSRTVKLCTPETAIP
jgi:hypothetical protein